MRRLLPLLRRFRDDERGVFAIIFALIAIVLIAVGGAVVDFVGVQQARTRTQLALDSAALALQPRIFIAGTTEAGLRTQAEALLLERLNAEGGTWVKCPSASGGACAEVDSATITAATGSLNLRASLSVPTNFVSLVGVTSLPSTLIAEATRKKLALEVAFVLDNSNSMNDPSSDAKPKKGETIPTRMAALITATKCAVNVLLNDDCDSTSVTTTVDHVKIAIIPFTMLVNVNKTNATATWLDRKGYNSVNNSFNSINNDNFDDDDLNNFADATPATVVDTTPFNTNVDKKVFDRIALFNSMTNVTWGGCVEARKAPYDQDDTVPTSTAMDTMFTPLFVPDEPDSGGYYNNYMSDAGVGSACKKQPTCDSTQVKLKCTSSQTTANGYNGASCQTNPAPVTTVNYTNESGTLSHPASCPTSAYNHAGVDTVTYTSEKIGTNNYTLTRKTVRSYAFTQREWQERICKYAGAAAFTSNISGGTGPNSDCPANPIVPLTTTKATITAAIAALKPQGGTNIHAGTEWGFRVLSPTEPFTQGAAYTDTTNRKILIIMTDGDNTAYQTSNMNNSTFYSQYGYPWNGRMGTSTSTDAALETEMNVRTLATCNNAKDHDRITIYTIGFNSKVQTSIDMLTACASQPSYAFFPTDATELKETFESIANDLSELKLVK